MVTGFAVGGRQSVSSQTHPCRKFTFSIHWTPFTARLTASGSPSTGSSTSNLNEYTLYLVRNGFIQIQKYFAPSLGGYLYF